MCISSQIFRALLSALIAATLVLAGVSAQAATLETDEPNDFTSSDVPGSFFDITPTANIRITGFAAYSNAAGAGEPGDPFTIQVFTKSGSYVGSELTAADWTLVQTFAGTDSDDATPEILTLTTPLSVAAGQTVGFALFGTSGGLQWFDDCGGDLSYMDGTMTLDVHHNRGADDGFNKVDICRSFAGQVIYEVVPPTIPTVPAVSRGGLLALALAFGLALGTLNRWNPRRSG